MSLGGADMLSLGGAGMLPLAGAGMLPLGDTGKVWLVSVIIILQFIAVMHIDTKSICLCLIF